MLLYYENIETIEKRKDPEEKVNNLVNPTVKAEQQFIFTTKINNNEIEETFPPNNQEEKEFPYPTQVEKTTVDYMINKYSYRN